MFAIDGIDRAEFELLLRAYGKECAREALAEAGAVKPTLTTAEVAEMLHFASVDSVHRLVKANKLRAKRRGRSFLFLRSDVDAYMRDRPKVESND